MATLNNVQMNIAAAKFSPEKTTELLENMRDLMLARIAANGGDMKGRSSEPLRELLKLPNSLCEALYASACQNQSIGNFVPAEKMFSALCLLSPNKAEYFLGYGLSLIEQGGHKAAEKILKRARDARPDWAAPYFHLARVYLQLERYEEANAQYAKCLDRVDDETPLEMKREAEQFVSRFKKRSDVRTG